MRSKLFVSGSRPELFAKALAGDADAISIDLEDAVVEARKGEARATVGAWLREQAPAASGGKLIIVRVNGMDTPHFELDVAAVVQSGLHIVNLPKPESPQAVRAACAAIERAELANGVGTPVRLLLNIETPRALREAAALALAHPRVMGLQVGLGDLFEPYGIDRREAAAVQHVLVAVRLRPRKPASMHTTARLPTCRTRPATWPRRSSRGGSASPARAASIRARWRWPIKHSGRPTRRSPMPSR